VILSRVKSVLKNDIDHIMMVTSCC